MNPSSCLESVPISSPNFRPPSLPPFVLFSRVFAALGNAALSVTSPADNGGGYTELREQMAVAAIRSSLTLGNCLFAFRKSLGSP